MVNNPDMNKRLAFIVFPVSFLTVFLGANLQEFRIVSPNPKPEPTFRSLAESTPNYSKGILIDMGFRKAGFDYVPREEYPSFEPGAPKYNPQTIEVNIVARPPPVIS